MVPYLEQIVMRPQAIPSPQLIYDRLSSTIIAAWTNQTTHYQRWWNWYDNAALEVELKKNVMKFPLRINPIRWICNKHGRMLYGEYPDDASTLVQFGFKNRENEVDDDCYKAADFVNTVWHESNGAALQIEQGVTSQVLGGHVYRVAWQPWNKRLTYGFRVTKVIPDYFLPIWDMDDPWYTSEVYVIYYITGTEAQNKYKVDVQSRPYVLYTEHWTNDEYKITVDNKVPPLEGFHAKNPFGMVPFVYTPHMSRVGGAYGMSHVPSLIGLTEELNSRMADRGDGVKNANFDRGVLRNAPNRTIQVKTLGDDQQVLDIGGGIPGSQFEPDLFYLKPNSVLAADLSKQFTDDIWNLICHEADTPAILWGSNDTSQRAAVSMDTLAGAYVAHARAERVMNRVGMNIINWMLLKMANVEGVGDISEKMTHLTPSVKWAKLMPRERMDLVNEMVQRKTAQLVSTTNAVTQLAQGEDIPNELEAIEEELQKIEDKQTAMMDKTHQQNMEAQKQQLQLKLQSQAAKKGDKISPNQEKK